METTTPPTTTTPGKVTKRTHPTDQGWLYLKITLKSGHPRNPQELAFLACCGGDPARYDIAKVEQNGNIVRAVTREKNWQPQPQPAEVLAS